MQVSIEKIDASKTNPRKHFDQGALEELAESIADKGVLQPVLVRTHPEDADRYELVCGERRFRASQLADQETIPIVLRELDDAEVLEVQIAENNQREDVSPLEEADAMLQLKEQHGRTAEEIAAKLGRPVSYVSRRLRLTSLIGPLRKLMIQERIGILSAEMLGQAPKALQEELAGDDLALDSKDWQGNLEKWNTTNIRRVINLKSRELDKAPWDLEQPFTSPPAPACHHCPERTGAQPALLSQLDNGDRCLNGQCWEAKKATWWNREADKLRKDGQKPVDPKEASEIFEGWYRQKSWVKASDRAGDSMTWGEVAPDDVKRHAALENHWKGPRITVLLRKQDVFDKLEATGRTALLEKIQRRSGGQTKADREAKRRRAERRVERITAVVEWVEGQSSINKDMLHALAYAVIKEANVDEVRATRKRRDLDKAEGDYPTSQEKHALLERLDELTTSEMFGMIVEVLITPSSKYYAYRPETAWTNWAELAGVDPKWHEEDNENDSEKGAA